MLAIAALCLRLLFSFWGSKYYFGEIRFTFGDSFSYTDTFLNLLRIGEYTFDTSEPDAYLYRGPVYALYWGMHYLLFGEEYVYKVVAISQCIIDTLSTMLIYRIIRSISQDVNFALAGMALYAFHPIFIVHTPITGTETIATCITLTTFATVMLARNNGTYVMWLIVGLLCGLGVLTRQYLGLLLPTVILYYLCVASIKNTKNFFTIIFCIMLGFFLLTAPWLIRNIIFHNAPTILMGKTSGYKAYKEDYIAFQRLYTLYFVDVTPILLRISKSGRDGLDDDPRLKGIRSDLERASELAYSCGTSFGEVRRWGNNVLQDIKTDERECNAEIVSIYEYVRAKALKEGGFTLWIDVPVQNVIKAVFKSELTSKRDGWVSSVITSIFFTRTLFALLGLMGIFFIARVPEFVFVFFPISLIAYISAITRQVEMRYLLQSDALLLSLSMVTVAYFFRKRTKKD